MKGFFAGILLLIMGSTAGALELRDVVMAEDYTELPVYSSFPCSVYIDVVSCGRFLVLEKKCGQSLEFKNDVYSCVSLKGDLVEFARVDRGQKIEDRTLPGTRGFRMNFSPRVRLDRFVSPNGNQEFQLVVE